MRWRRLLGAVLLVGGIGTGLAVVPSATAGALAATTGKGPTWCAHEAGGYDLGAHYDDVYACGPRPGASFPPTAGDTFQPQGGYQCTELANRFLWDRWQIAPVFGTTLDGTNFADTVGAERSVRVEQNGVAGDPYLPGDIVSFKSKGSLEPTGHVAVVIASTENTSGDGTVTIMEENSPATMAPTGEQTLTVATWSLQMTSKAYVAPKDFDALATGGAPGTPANGTFVQVSGQTPIYRIAGGAPLYVSGWTAFGGVQPYSVISRTTFDHLNPVPANGTMIAVAGNIYEIAGGAPLYVSAAGCPALSCTTNDVAVDPWDLTNITNPLAHLHPVPANGTMIAAAGNIYEIAGGAPLYVSAAGCPALSCTTNDVAVDPWDLTNITNPLAHLHPVPANGTIIRTATNGFIYVVAGGAALYLHSCTSLPEDCGASVNVDPWDLANAGAARSGLESHPATGTTVEALPSGRYWAYEAGCWAAVTASPGSSRRRLS